MPIYVYECPHCKGKLEIARTVQDRDYPVVCPNGTGCDPVHVEMKRIIAPTTFILKGPGWAKDGYSK